MTIYIYPVTDIRIIKGQKDGHYGYLLQAVKDGRVTGWRTGWKECRDDTQGALIRAVSEAAGRITDKGTNVLILSDSCPVIDGILNLHKWELDGWKRSRGREIRRREAWQQVSQALDGMKIAAQKMNTDTMESFRRRIQKEAENV